MIANLRRRREIDSSFTLEEAKRILQQLYVQDGNDWLGRGELQDAILHAQIAAHETFIHEWEKEARGA
jgi:hypothetical protein